MALTPSRSFRHIGKLWDASKFDTPQQAEDSDSLATPRELLAGVRRVSSETAPAERLLRLADSLYTAGARGSAQGQPRRRPSSAVIYRPPLVGDGSVAALRRSPLHRVTQNISSVSKPHASALTRHRNEILSQWERPARLSVSTAPGSPLGPPQVSAGTGGVGPGAATPLPGQPRFVRPDEIANAASALLDGLAARPLLALDAPRAAAAVPTAGRGGAAPKRRAGAGQQQPEDPGSPASPGLALDQPPPSPKAAGGGARRLSEETTYSEGGAGARDALSRLVGRRVPMRPLTNRERIRVKLAHMRGHPRQREQFARVVQAHVRTRRVRVPGEADFVTQNKSDAGDVTFHRLPSPPPSPRHSPAPPGDGASLGDSTAGSLAARPAGASAEVSFRAAVPPGARVCFRRAAQSGELQCEVNSLVWRCPQVLWDHGGRDLLLPDLGCGLPPQRLRGLKAPGAQYIAVAPQRVRPPRAGLVQLLTGLRDLALSCRHCAVGIGPYVAVAGKRQEHTDTHRAARQARADAVAAARAAAIEATLQQQWEWENAERLQREAAYLHDLQHGWAVAVCFASSLDILHGALRRVHFLRLTADVRNWAALVIQRRLWCIQRRRAARAKAGGVKAQFRAAKRKLGMQGMIDRRKEEITPIVRQFIVAVAGCIQMRARVAQVLFRCRLTCLQRWIRRFVQRKAFQLQLMDMQWRKVEAALAQRLRHEEMVRLRGDLEKFIQWRDAEKKVHGVLPRELQWREGVPWDPKTFRLLASMVEMRANTLKEQDLRGIAADIGYFSRRAYYTQPGYRQRRLWEELTQRRRTFYRSLPLHRDALRTWQAQRDHLEQHITHESAAAQEAMLSIAHARPRPEPPAWSIMIDVKQLHQWIREGWQQAEGREAEMSPEAAPLQVASSPKPAAPSGLQRAPPSAAPKAQPKVQAIKVSRWDGGAAAVPVRYGPAGRKPAGLSTQDAVWSAAMAPPGLELSPAEQRRVLRAEAAVSKPTPGRPSSASAKHQGRRLTPTQWAGRTLLASRPTLPHPGR
eukprot:TRINITY_DN47436_c0_g1_i1.p1 TRINITY_DN47436_c0_g1~~TRINITY_DN47436_c0_g1_i1.p1  ORF type:complete len:1029 (+),score=264.26 TRINITY_DN47436_c0_g1_i1:116-3202(+)